MKKLAFLILLLTLISCKSEKRCDSINFKGLQKDYSLFEVSNELSNDTLNYTAKVYYKKNDFFPRHGLFVVLNKKGDTLFKYFGDKRIIVNSTIFKKNKNYFIVLANSKNSSYRLTQNDIRSKFFQIDTLNKTLLDIEPLDGDIFNHFFYQKMGKKMSNGMFYKKGPNNSEFNIHCDLIINDTIYSVTCPLEFIKDDSGKYKLFAQPKELKKQSIRDKQMQNTTTTRNIPFGKIKGYELVYDCSNCRTASTDAITVYAKKDTIKTKLFSSDFGGNYLDKISLQYFKNHPFIYVHSAHTYGHSNGTLYALDIRNLITNKVNTIKSNIKVPDSLYPRNYYGVDIDKNGTLSFGIWYRSENGNGRYSLKGKYDLIKVKHNIYLLDPKNVRFEKNQ